MAGVVTRSTLSGGAAVSAYSAFTGINAVSSANYTGTDTDGYSRIHISTGASDRTYTPPTASADNAGRVIHLMKTDSGAGGLIIGGTISGSSSNNTIKAQYGYAAIVSDGSAWYWHTDIQEKGTWTPTISWSGVQGSTTYSAQVGWYTRSGRTITYGGLLSFVDASDTATGALRVTVPFTAAATSGYYAASASRIEDRMTIPANHSGMYSYITNNTNLISFYWLPSAGGTATSVQASTVGTSTADIIIGGSYLVD